MDYIATFLAYAIALLMCWYLSTAWKRSPARRHLWKKLDCMAFRFWLKHPYQKFAICVVTNVEHKASRVTGRHM